MHFGLHLPTAGDAAAPALLQRVAREAEQLGLASLWMSEGLLRPTRQPVDFGGGISITMPAEGVTQCEPVEALAYVAAVTERIRLGTSVIGVLFQNPVLLARRLATVDLLSGGRLVAGLGQGWVPQAFTAAGMPMRDRGAGFEEYLAALRAVWGPNPVAFDGRFVQIPESDIGPKPARHGDIPIVLAAGTSAAAQRAGSLRVGLHPVLNDWEWLGVLVHAFRAAAAAAGHDPEQLPIVVRVNGAVSAGRGPRPTAPLTGPADKVAGELARLTEMGVSEVMWAMLATPPDVQLDGMRALLATVG